MSKENEDWYKGYQSGMDRGFKDAIDQVTSLLVRTVGVEFITNGSRAAEPLKELVTRVQKLTREEVNPDA